jgi:enamine deaminase RidA (YjgF/YER057c/UK114 family)
MSDSFKLIGSSDMAAQIRRIYGRLERVLAMADATLKNVASKMSYTTDIEALGKTAHVRTKFYQNSNTAAAVAAAVDVRELFLEGAMLEFVAPAELP